MPEISDPLCLFPVGCSRQLAKEAVQKGCIWDHNLNQWVCIICEHQGKRVGSSAAKGRDKHNLGLASLHWQNEHNTQVRFEVHLYLYMMLTRFQAEVRGDQVLSRENCLEGA